MSEPKTLLIDDLRSFKNNRAHLVARTASEALTLLQQFKFTKIFFDHDLGEEGGSIWDVVAWLDSHEDYPVQACYIHTMNPVGGDRLMQALGRNFNCVRINAREHGLYYS